MNCEDSDLAAGGIMMIPGSSQIIGGGKMGKLYLVNTANLGQENDQRHRSRANHYVEQNVMSPYSAAAPTVPAITPPRSIPTKSSAPLHISTDRSISALLRPQPTPRPACVASAMLPAPTAFDAREAPRPTFRKTLAAPRPSSPPTEPHDGIVWMIDEGQPLGTPRTNQSHPARLRRTNLSSQGAIRQRPDLQRQAWLRHQIQFAGRR